ncbi:MAG: tetratricopeptide repeat protein, partial [Bacteroidia bacterium]
MKKNWLILFYLLFSAAAFSQLTDTVKIRKLYFQAYDLEKSNPDSAIKLYEALISQTKANPNQKTIGMSYHRLAETLYNQKNDLNKYFSLCFTAIKIFEAIKDSIAATQIYQNLGINLVRQNRFEEALAYHKKVVNYSARHHLSNLLIAGTMSIAECYSSLNKNDTAILILKNLVNNFPKDGKQSDFGMLLNNLGNTYYNLADITGNKKYFINSIEYATKALDVLNKLPEEYSNLAYSYGLLGAGNMAIENYAEAEKQYESAIKIYKKKHLANDLNLMYFELTQLNIKQGKTDKALNYFGLYDSVSKQLFNSDNSNSISLMKTQFETEKKETENKLLQKENDQQKQISYFIVGGLIIALLFSLFIFRGLKAQRKANKIISKQKDEVHHQKEIVEEKQKEILDSIHYAKRIQRAVITSDTYISQHVKNYFIYYQPKDIVSGDFYWALHTNNKFYLVTADCTGHGVPGAFMSLLNISILNEVMIEKKITRVDLILNEAR